MSLLRPGVIKQPKPKAPYDTEVQVTHYILEISEHNPMGTIQKINVVA